MSLADNLKYLMESKDDNPESAAVGMGISSSAVRKILSGTVEDPNLSTLKAISRYYAVPVAFVIGEIGTNIEEYERRIYARGWLEGKEKALKEFEKFLVAQNRTLDLP